MNELKKIRIFPGMFAGLLTAGLGGCLVIYGACAFNMEPSRFLVRQLIWLAIGLLIFRIVSLIPFSKMKRYAYVTGGGALLSMILVLIFGTSRYGMRGWFALGSVIIQPSELMKGPFLLLISSLMTREDRPFFFSALCGTLFTGVILMEPDFGSASVYFAAFLIVSVTVGTPWRLLLCFLTAALGAAGVFLLLHPYAFRRILGFLNPDADFFGMGWHIKQFRYSMAQGGLFGTESGSAVWANAYLPLSHSDSAFASIMETSGLIGGMLIVSGFIAMVIVLRKIAMQQQDRSAAMMTFAGGAMVAAQALIHISVNVTFFPTTGLTLPFFSYGGSSLLGTMILFGMICSAANDQGVIV